MLDLMRGVAAIAVLLYHDGGFIGVRPLPNAYLAVDLFFLLSGFVIAHNYDRKISGGMSLTDFMVQRLIRLYPCLLLTLLLGIVIFCLRMTREFGFFDGWRILWAAVANALFLPTLVDPYDVGSYFPFNGAAWSLTFELIANLLYWITFRYLNGLRIALLIAVSAVGLTVAAYAAGTPDVGMRSSDFGWGVPRVTLTFFIGVALRRYAHERLALDLGGKAALIAIVVMASAFSLGKFVSPELAIAAEILIVAIVFPVLVLLVGGAIPGPRTAQLCKWTGDASYPVYLLQTPLMGVFAALPQLFLGMKAGSFVPWIGIAHVVATIALALWIDRYFELPFRRLLRDRWLAFRQSPAGGAQSKSAELR